MVGPLTMKLGTLIYHDKNINYNVLNNNKQPQAKNV